MSDDYQHTPPPPGAVGNVIEHRINSMEIKYDDIKKMAISNRESLIELVGSSGQNGRISFIASKLEKIDAEIQEIQMVMENQRKFLWKFCAAILATSAGGAGLTQAVIAMMGGG